jgi:hypothetical protein
VQSKTAAARRRNGLIAVHNSGASDPDEVLALPSPAVDTAENGRNA